MQSTAQHNPVEERERVFLWIKKLTLRIREGDFPVYLIRYSLFKCPWFAVKLHKIILSDEDYFHDHPWSFISIILKGGYIEHTPERSRLYGAGSILWRPSPSIHKIQVYQPATTLVITFKKTRTWGFYTGSGFVKWFDFYKKK